MLNGQAQQHRAEADEQQAILGAAEAEAERMRAEVVVPLIEQATADGTAYLAARRRVWEASDAQRAARGLGKRRAGRRPSEATDEHRTIETAGRSRWGRLPETPAGVEAWAASVARREADADPRVTETQEQAEEARHEQQQLAVRQAQERQNLRRQLLGDRAPSRTGAQAGRWRERAAVARRHLATIKALPPTEAAELIRTRAEQEQAKREASERTLAEREARSAQLHDLIRRPIDHEPKPPDRGHGSRL